jgi:hypothetical protein
MTALFMQFIWLAFSRRAKNQYISDITRFRAPSSFSSKYYSWHLRKVWHSLLEGVIFQIFLISTIIVIVDVTADFDTLIYISPIIAFVAVLSFISSIQAALRVKEVLEREASISAILSKSDDKIGDTKEMIEDLMLQGPHADGRIWFALFKLALRQDALGWSIRDALFEKNKEIANEMRRGEPITREPQTKQTSGPEIESD